MKVISNLEYVFRCMGVNILPGINYVEHDRFFQHPAVKARIEKGDLEIGKDALNVKEHTKKTAKQLIKDIPNIFDIKLLERIKSADSRATVMDAIDKQINKIKAE